VKNYQAYRPGTGVELQGAPAAGRQTAAPPAGALRRRRGRAGRYNARNKFRNLLPCGTESVAGMQSRGPGAINETVFAVNPGPGYTKFCTAYILTYYTLLV
jgi:hypothetical protein